MKVFVVLSCIALAVARPEAGYSYNQPGGGFGGAQGGQGLAGPSFGLNTPGAAPAPSFTGSNAFSSGGSFGGPSFGGAAAAGPSFGGPSFGGPSGAPSFGGPSFGGAAAPASSFSAGPSFGAPQQSFGPQQSFAPQGQTIVQKHIYVHVPPPQEEDFHQPQLAPAQPQKHYKIIFIKAPSAPGVNPQQLQALTQPQNEEKTLVYVLVKKPESLAEVAQNIQPVPVVPSKPEVYFIKYKAQKEQQQQFHAPAPAPAPAPHFPSSGSAVASLPIPAPQKPSPVYGPGH